ARQELAQSSVPAIIEARFGPEVVEAGRSVLIVTGDDRLAETIAFAAICPDFDSFYRRARVAGRPRETWQPRPGSPPPPPAPPPRGALRPARRPGPKGRPRPPRSALTPGHDGLMTPDAGRSRLR